jgi:cation diffusion facilitator family transporter
LIVDTSGKCLSAVEGRWSVQNAAVIRSGEQIPAWVVPTEVKEGDFVAAETNAKKTKVTKSFAYVALLSVGFNILLVLLKYGLSILSGSIALRADAIHSLVDVLSSLGIFVGIKISERRSSSFPYGMYKVENLAALATSLFIFFAAYEIVKEIIYTDPTANISSIPIAVSGLFVIIILMLLFSRYELKVGRKAGSPSLVADAKHIGTDLLSSLGVMLGLLLSLWKSNFDRFVAVIIIVLIARLGWTILSDSVKVLLDASIKQETLNDIRNIFFNFPDVKDVTELSGRCSGRYKFVEAEIILDTEKLLDAHDISSAIEEEVYDCFPEVDKILIHYEPAKEQKKE